MSILMKSGAGNMDAVVEDQTFEDCTAENVHLDFATLTRVAFTRCDLYWATFANVHLTNVTFDQCDLRGSIFKKAVSWTADSSTAT